MKKNILLCLTAGVAIYKVCEVIRKLKNDGYDVKCIMTQNATKLISPILVEQLSGNKVYVDMFEEYEYSPTHISLSKWADLIAVLPCSCNTISKLAYGKTEDLLSCTIYACDLKRTKVLIFPSMNTNMWLHPITKKNVKILKDIGYVVVEPKRGKLLCGDEGIGRMPEVEEVVKYIKDLMNEK